MSLLSLRRGGKYSAFLCAALLLAPVLAKRALAAEPWVEQGHQIPADGGAGDNFGIPVAIDGDTAVVGSAGHDRGSEDNVGAAYVYNRINGAWVFQQKLMASDGTGTNIFGDQFGASVGISGDTIIIGADQDDTPTGGNAGSAYIFTRTAGVWTEQQHLFASAGNPGAAFGCAVAIEGDTAVVGSFWEDSSSGTNAGAAYVFKRTGTTWALQQRLNSPDVGDGMLFGISVAVSGPYMVIGSHVGAYLFYRSTPNWIFAQKWQALNGNPDDNFGHSVAVHGDVGVVGAPLDDTAAGMDAGSAYIFQIRNGLEPLQQKVTASNAAERDRYGYAVAVDGEKVLIGAYNGDTSEGANTGAAYLIARNAGVWAEEQILKGSDTAINDGFAIGVAMRGGRAIVGAYQHAQVRNGNTIVSGGTYIFGPPETVPCNLRIERRPGFPGQTQLVFGPIVAGQTYVVKSKANLTDPSWQPLQNFGSGDNGNERIVIDGDQTVPKKFYRVEITRP